MIFTGKDISRAGLFKVIGLAVTGPPTQEVICGNNQDGDPSDTTNNTTNNSNNIIHPIPIITKAEEEDIKHSITKKMTDDHKTTKSERKKELHNLSLDELEQAINDSQKKIAAAVDDLSLLQEAYFAVSKKGLNQIKLSEKKFNYFIESYANNQDDYDALKKDLTGKVPLTDVKKLFELYQAADYSKKELESQKKRKRDDEDNEVTIKKPSTPKSEKAKTPSNGKSKGAATPKSTTKASSKTPASSSKPKVVPPAESDSD